MIGLASPRSTATPCAFIETSIAPLLAPNTNRIAPSAYGLGASSGRGSIRQNTSAATRVTDALGAPVEEVAGQRHRDERAGRHAEQAEPDRRLGDAR